ncbi:MAG TPA: cupin domain-containing protein [Candidatus Elarobacter sp.]
MRSTVIPGVWTWSRWQPDRNLDFNSFFVETEDGNLVVDPLEPDDATLAELRERGVKTIVVTNRDHERFSAAVAAATGAEIVASALDAPLLAQPPSRTVQPGEFVHGWRVIGVAGAKTPGEIVLYRRALRTAIVGDVIWGTPAGALTLMPDAKLTDPPRAALSLRELRERVVDNLLVGDGACIFGNAHLAIGTMLDARTDAFVDRVNVDELPLLQFPDDPPPYTGGWNDVGRMLGAEKLGYGVLRLPRGTAFCPYHWHTREEELFVVMRGTPALRTPRGTQTLRPGDLIAFPTGPNGAHRLENHADEDAIVLAIANTDPGDACFYPDSQKFVVEATGTLVRDHPILDYFEGEV